MQFKRMFVDKILKGEKTQTRRKKISWYKVGKIVPAQCGYRDKAFAKLRITDIREEFLCEISQADARKEGLKDVDEYIKVWEQINGEWDPNLWIYVIDFEKVKEAI